jgi:hypothetical protein
VTTRSTAVTESGPRLEKQNKTKTKGKSMAWLFTRMGFYSVVKTGSNTDEWKVRSRSRQDLENLIKAADLRGQKVIQTYGADYLYRIIVNSDELSQIFTAIQESVTYTNYKGILQATPGQEKLCTVAHAIWSLVAEKFGGAYQQRGGNRQRSLLASERDERTFGASSSKRTIHATDSHTADSTLDDVEPPTPPMPKKHGSGRKPKSKEQALPDRELDLPTSETNAV